MATFRMKRPVLVALTAVAMAAVTVLPGLPVNRVEAAGIEEAGTLASRALVACYGPCVYLVNRTPSSITIGWGDPPDYPERSDAFNLTWSRPGRAETGLDVGKSYRFTLNHPWPHTTYTFKVQGCERHFLAPSTCTPFQVFRVTT